MATKKLQQFTTIKSLEQAADVMRDLKNVSTEIDSVASKIDAQITKLQESLSNQTEPLKEKKLQFETNLRLYCEENRSVLFADTKTIKTPFGVYGFRKMPPSVKILMKKTEDVIEAIKAGGKRFAMYIQSKPTIDKNALKKSYTDGAISDRDLKAMGLAIVSEDEFAYSFDAVEIGT